MSQNSRIAAALIIGFIVFITMKGELPQYLAILGLSNAALPGATSGTSAAPASLFSAGGFSLPSLGLGNSTVFNAPIPGNVNIGPTPQGPGASLGGSLANI